MKTFLLVLALSSTGKALVIAPTEYPTEAKCIEAGKSYKDQITIFQYGIATFACIPSGSAP